MHLGLPNCTCSFLKQKKILYVAFQVYNSSGQFKLSYFIIKHLVARCWCHKCSNSMRRQKIGHLSVRNSRDTIYDNKNLGIFVSFSIRRLCKIYYFYSMCLQRDSLAIIARGMSASFSCKTLSFLCPKFCNTETLVKVRSNCGD